MKIENLISAIEFLRKRGSQAIWLAYERNDPTVSMAGIGELGVSGVIVTDQRSYAGQLPAIHPSGLPLLDIETAKSGAVDGIIIIEDLMWSVSRSLSPVIAARDPIVIPADSSYIVPDALRSMHLYDIWNSFLPVHYVAASGLSGHYVEFGTYCGMSFFNNFFRFREVLKGNFYAFDSFKGLPTPLEKEVQYTASDFHTSAYNFNQRSFTALGDLFDMSSRLRIVPGFYEQSLIEAGLAERIGLAPKSISVCYIDCDLYSSTRAVLNFVRPLLDDGALLFFDDWLSCRANPNLGERGATLHWMAQNPEIDLVLFPFRETPGRYANHWFIYNRCSEQSRAWPSL